MPIYEYVCRKMECPRHGEVVTVIQGMLDDHDHPCVQCGRPMERTFTSPPAVAVRGGTPIHHHRGS